MVKFAASLFVAPLLAFSVLVDQAHAGSRRSFGLHQGFAPMTINRRSQQSTAHYSTASRPSGLEFLESDADKIREVQPVNLYKNLLRGAFLRVASDLSGGTPLESIKCRVTTTRDGPVEATRNIIKNGGPLALWSGTPSRTVEGALLGAVFILGSSITKKQVKAMGAGPTMVALAGGLVGGVAQSVVMTPAGVIFTSLNVNQGKKGHENDNAITVCRRIINEKGFLGLYRGLSPMALRQATNWASRAGFTEICRTSLKLTQYGAMGEIAAGAIGGVGSCWNTPIETVRVLIARDVSMGKPTKKFGEYWDNMVEEQGYPGLFRGIKPRAVQAIWQTVFMVVVPTMLGM